MFQGSCVAIVTPFADGAFDEEAFRGLIEFQMEGGTDVIVPCGTTGESPTLSHDEHRRVIRATVEAVAGRAKVLAGTGSNNTAEAVELTRFAKEAGADGALVICPYYNKPTQAGLIDHFQALIKACAFPMVIYNIQGRTAVNMTPETMARLAETPEIVGVKEASGNLGQMTEIIRLTEGLDFTVLSGDDGLTLPLMAIGGKGVISVVNNLIPADVKAMVAAALAGDFATAREWHYKMLPLMNAMFVETNPIPIKAALAMTGRITGEVRLPMTAPSAANLAKIKEALTAYGVL
jgi:4-hydroxy-tetrahydrodipicolinate synthase